MPTPSPPSKGDASYGSAPEGSLSEERAKKASAWVEKEVDKLCAEIANLGVKQSGSQVTVTFGELFQHYQDVSDTLVGILARAKKRGLLQYQGEGGDLLFQRKHDHVVITMDAAKVAAWRKTLGSTPETSPSSAGAPPKPTLKQIYEEEKRAKAAAVASGGSNGAATPSPVPSRQSSPHDSIPKASPVNTPVHTPAPTPTPPRQVSVKAEPVLRQSSPPKTPVAASAPQEPPAEQPAAPSYVGSFLQLVMDKVGHSAAPAAAENGDLPSTSTAFPGEEPGAMEKAKQLASRLSRYLSGSEDSEAAAATPAQQQQQQQVAHAPMAALPQRTRDGTRGAVVYTSPGKPQPKTLQPSPSRAVAVAASHVSAPKPVPAASKPATAATAAAEEWKSKHVQRGVVGGAAASRPAHNGAPAASSVAKKLAAFEKSNQDVRSAQAVGKKADLPTGLTRKFAWES